MPYNEDGTAMIDHFDFGKVPESQSLWYVCAMCAIFFILAVIALYIESAMTPNYSTSTMMIDGKEIIIIEKRDGIWQAFSKDPLWKPFDLKALK